MNSILMLFGGAVAALLAREVAKKLQRIAPGAVKTLDGKIPGIVDSLEERTGWDVPDGFEEAFNQTLHNIVIRGAAFAETYVYNAAFWEKVFRALMSSKTDNALNLAKQLGTWLKNVDWKSQFMLSLPEELKPIVNQVKEQEALKATSNGVGLFVASSKASMVLPPNANITLTDEELRPMVRQAASALKLQPSLMEQYNQSGMTKALAEEISKRHEARMEEMRR